MSIRSMQKHKSIMVWNWYIRLFHFSLILSLPALYLTAHEGFLVVHQYLGIFLLVLIALRILMGLWGSHFTRFKQFLYSPITVFHYGKTLFKRHSTVYTGHNPAGGYMVIALLSLLTIQAIMGLFSMDDVIFEGPLAFLISSELSERITHWHHELFEIILLAIGIHITAVLWYQFYKKQPLIQSMVHGRKPISEQECQEKH